MYSAQTKDDITKEFLGDKREKRVWPVWHRTCRDIAFLYDQPVKGGLESRHAYDYNGRQPELNSPMVCCACKETIRKTDLCAQRPGELIALPGENPILKILRS